MAILDISYENSNENQLNLSCQFFTNDKIDDFEIKKIILLHKYLKIFERELTTGNLDHNRII